MNYNIKDLNDKKVKKSFLNEIKELINTLINMDEIEKIQDDQKSIQQKLIEVGVISKQEELEAVLSLVDKEFHIPYDEFVSLISKIQHDETKNCCVYKFCNYCIDNISCIEEKDDKPVIVDLFCGAGGMSLGFKQAGFKIAFANDIEQSCIETYSFNHPELPKEYIYHEDINNIIEEIDERIRYSEVDVVIGGPPCQGFSNANRQRIIDDPRNKLYKSFVKIVEKLQPKFFVMENVQGMLSVASQVQEDFEAIGYKLHCEVLNALDFGVPQNRKRIIFIGNRLGLDNASIFAEINLQNAYLNRQFTLRDAIEKLPKLEALRVKNATNIESEESGRVIAKYPSLPLNHFLLLINSGSSPEILYNHKARYNNDRDIEIFGRMNQGDKSDDPKIADIMPYQSRNGIFKDKYYKLIYDAPCKTITAHMKFDCNMYIHPTQARGLTPREAARVQTFPDDYFFKGSYTKTYMQVGNAVPPLMSRGIAEAVLKSLKETELKSTNN
ncbi:DNA cytosine methyltransferase [Metabacillus halosaccharovorans]|uniref:DNA cytosine methyltransferase n=1 Tax=Metabacillus halosaccharovorans TaxID=930124 RepID=UPI001C56975E|nr:DNA cytosine methyltransferase [Metabacillus halosaccharovorans]